MKTLDSGKRKARKEHSCNFCGGTIEIGETYMRSTHVFDNTLYSWKTHLSCQALVIELDMYDYCDDDVTEDDFRECIFNAFHDIKLKEFGISYRDMGWSVPFEEQLKIVKEYLKN